MSKYEFHAFRFKITIIYKKIDLEKTFGKIIIISNKSLEL